MGFFTFNEAYYLVELSRFEGKPVLDGTDLTEIKQILKLLDDLADEGYSSLNEELEGKHQVLTRLRNLLSAYGEKPFPILSSSLPQVQYGGEELEIEALSRRLIQSAEQERSGSDNPFLREFLDYCRWIPWEPDTAYLFLLRDAFLPFLYFQSRGRTELFPWLVGRSFLSQITGTENMDDAIRLPIYEALEKGIIEFAPFREFCRERILKVLEQYPPLKQTLTELLRGIRAKRILVIESGYCGTIPMLLSVLDERIDFRLYTTAPFLYETYREKIFCRRYENIRLFETLYSQDILIKYASFRQGRFYVTMAQENQIQERALGEIRRFLPAFEQEP